MSSVATPAHVDHVGHLAELRPVGALRWVTTVDHKDIGILYLLTSLLFLVIGGSRRC